VKLKIKWCRLQWKRQSATWLYCCWDWVVKRVPGHSSWKSTWCSAKIGTGCNYMVCMYFQSVTVMLVYRGPTLRLLQYLSVGLHQTSVLSCNSYLRSLMEFLRLPRYSNVYMYVWTLSDNLKANGTIATWN